MCPHKIVIYTAAVPEPILLYTLLPGVYKNRYLHGSRLRGQIGYIHCCRVYTKNLYLHGSRSRANRLYTLMSGVYIKSLFTRQPSKSQIETAALTALNAIKQRVLLDRNGNKIFHCMIRLGVKPQQLRFGEIDTSHNISGHRNFLAF